MVCDNEDQRNANQKAKQADHVVLVHPQKISLVQDFHLNIAESVRSVNIRDVCICIRRL